ncbi:uncharacterized protein LOC130856032 [Hippopotamus amphibius kiboko]|uniref:uncharacterized protein LOC130856032 n=1 Tax=Hippopotamus amphibius kiboko TaxID=575201 RepID=UPI00259664FB|nr:uncharacterized protein LOC130856032 [Hippopotamus amphibius kiboko]
MFPPKAGGRPNPKRPLTWREMGQPSVCLDAAQSWVTLFSCVPHLLGQRTARPAHLPPEAEGCDADQVPSVSILACNSPRTSVPPIPVLLSCTASLSVDKVEMWSEGRLRPGTGIWGRVRGCLARKCGQGARDWRWGDPRSGSSRRTWSPSVGITGRPGAPRLRVGTAPSFGLYLAVRPGSSQSTLPSRLTLTSWCGARVP